MNIAISTNEKYSRYAYIMLNSLIYNNPDEEIVIYVLMSSYEFYGNMLSLKELERNDNTIVNFVEVDKLFDFDKLPNNDQWSKEAWFRLAIPDLMPCDMERILYLDVDITVCDSIKALYQCEFDDKDLICCRDMATLSWNDLLEPQKMLLNFRKKDDDFLYFNSGVILFNLPRMRKDGYDFACFREAAEKYGELMYTKDQDLLNYIFDEGHIKLIDENIFDFFGYTSYKKYGLSYEHVQKNVAIVHWAGFKPWDTEAIRYPTERVFWDYAKMTPFYQELVEEVLMGEINNAYAAKNISELIEKLKIANKEKDTFIKTIDGYRQILKNLNVMD